MIYNARASIQFFSQLLQFRNRAKIAIQQMIALISLKDSSVGVMPHSEIRAQRLKIGILGATAEWHNFYWHRPMRSQGW